jgi:hypothetical protein
VSDAHRDALLRFAKEIESLPNESAKTHRFYGLIGEMFKGSKAVVELSRGTEKRVRIAAAAGDKHGRIDTYYGNVIIEFETSLQATGADAEYQLREYTSGVWTAEGATRVLICVATDGKIWKTYSPVRVVGSSKKVTPDQVKLEHLRTIELTSATIDEFLFWLTALLFRKGRQQPTPDAFRFDFGAQSVAYSSAIRDLREAWRVSGTHSENELKLSTWKRYLTFTYGSLDAIEQLQDLFLRHTYLASIARLLVWAVMSHGKTTQPLREVANQVFDGSYFRQHGIRNLVEDDFFSWITEADVAPTLAPMWERLLDQILTYDLLHIGNDILKGVYQELVDPAERHDLGEYYSPDWLCEAIVEELLPKAGFVRVIDPTCGSGSFLRAAIAKLLANNPEGGGAFRLSAILSSVVGIEIHPLAVTIARATYALALGPLLRDLRRPIQIPVYLADALFLPVEVIQLELGSTRTYEVRFGEKSVSIPESLVRNADLFDPAIDAATEVGEALARGEAESSVTLAAYLRNEVPAIAGEPELDLMVEALWEYARKLAKLIEARKDSIWSFVVRNSYKPAMLRESFDVCVGNPPWLSYRYIKDPQYQAEVKKRGVDEYQIAPRQQKLMTQMELATIFLVHTLNVFGKKGAKLAFVVPRSVLTADQHANLRTRNYVAKATVVAYWDLKGVTPLFKVPSCVLFAERKVPSRSRTYTLPVIEWEGVLRSQDPNVQEARSALRRRTNEARLIYLGERTALSTGGGTTHPTKSSFYRRQFRQGATLVPRNCYFVAIPELDGKPDFDRLYWAETEPEQAVLAKAPWRGFMMSGEVEGRYIYRAVMSKHVVPFYVLEPDIVVLPILMSGDSLQLLEAGELKARGDRKFAAWMTKVEKHWKKVRGKKSEATVTEWLNYQNKLTNQGSRGEALVLYNASGTNVSAASLDSHAHDGRLVIDHKLYWAPCDSRDEADYLAAVLNSETVNEAIKPFQSTGLLGERDIHKKVLDFPIPKFDPKRPAHSELAKWASEASERVAQAAKGADFPASLAARRKAVRQAIGPISARIEAGVKKLF